MARKEDKSADLAILIVVIIYSVLWLIAKIQLEFIHISRFFFWVFLTIIPISIGVAVFYIIKCFYDDWDRMMYLGIGVLSILVFIFSLSMVDMTYDNGYSEKALKKEAELIGKLQEYEEVLNLLSIHETISEEIIDTEIKALCESTPESCESIKVSYQTYKQIKGAKDIADNILFFKKASEKIGTPPN